MTITKTSAIAIAFGLANALPQVPSGLAIPPGAENLPDCAVTPLITLLTTTGCTQVTTDCLCQDPAATLATIQPAIRSSCTDDSEYDEVWSYVQGFCPISSSTTTTTTEAPTSSSSITSSTVLAQGTSTTTTTTNGTAIAFPAPTITATNGSSNGTVVITSPTPVASEIPIVSEGDASGYGMSFAALTVAIGCMTWVFAEL